ncbi:MAG: glutamate racemase [Candidatus Marinimicrobia bacterium]|nr:glutamate racemase [Candidatus Neomarinimicrobiota bacterium]MDD5582022.1 glutamate racemase [Candidatus Neomarinimicrobiota bacterium]
MKKISPSTDFTYLPIGIFDSGLGGLTVYRQIRTLLPSENIIYLGDTARVPYGSKSTATIRDFTSQITRFLLNQPVKALVIACNTASSLALDVVMTLTHLPVINVIEPGVLEALRLTQRKRVGVIGTRATIESEAYPKKIHEYDPSLQVYSVPCPLFVPLVEEGWEHHLVTKMIAEEYLNPLISLAIDTLILGCTHYPILKPVLQTILPLNVTIVDSSQVVAQAVRHALEALNLLNPQTIPGTDLFYVTDFPRKFTAISSRFLGYELKNIQKISIETLSQYSQQNP